MSEGRAWFGYHAASWTESLDMHCSYIVSASENGHPVAPVRLRLGRKQRRALGRFLHSRARARGIKFGFSAHNFS